MEQHLCSSKMLSMPRILISYDLRKPDYKEADYEDLYSDLEALGAKRIQESMWAVRTGASPSVVFDRLSAHLHSHDRLLVARIGAFKNFQGMHLLRLI